MAKIEFERQDSENGPTSVECIEVRTWGLGGSESQSFGIGSGFNICADGNIWVEIIYSVGGLQDFYTRNFLHYTGSMDQWENIEAYLDEIAQKGEGQIGFGDILPQTRVILDISKYTSQDAAPDSYCDLKIAVDMGTVFGSDSPGSRMIEINATYLDLEVGVRFIRELIHDIADTYQGKHPDPAGLPPGSSAWPLVRQLNERVYDAVSGNYQESYFENPLLRQAFDGWLAQLPAGAQVLDAGCGHGNPVIGRLLEKGFHVTGTDFSPAMLRRAKERYPQVSFVQQGTPEIDFECDFNGACSLSSTVYLDPVDLFHSIYRLHCALKPGGLLLLYGYDVHPDWRGDPYSMDLGHFMWTWTYGMNEVVRALEEHGYFEVLSAENVTPPEEMEKRRARILEQRRKAREIAEQRRAEELASRQQEESTQEVELERALPGQPIQDPFEQEPPALEQGDPAEPPKIKIPHFPDPLDCLPYCYAIIARRKERPSR